MSDIRDPAAFMAGRWKWTSCGYEIGFPRGSQFTDIDASVEFDERHLFIESKHCDGVGGFPELSTGQSRFLRSLARMSPGNRVFVLYGLAASNDPRGARLIGPNKSSDSWEDWRSLDLDVRQSELKGLIDECMGLIDRRAA